MPSKSQISSAVSRLTLRQHRTCSAVWIERRTQAQTAAAHGITVHACKKRMQRARRKLRAAGVEPPDTRRGGPRRPALQLSLNRNI